MIQPRRPRDIDAAMDRVDPGGAGIGDDDSGRAQDRQPADDAETAVQRPLGDLFPARDRQFDHDVTASAIKRGDLGDRRSDHLARHRVDRGLSGRQWQTGTGHRADALSGAKDDAAVRRGQADGCDDQRAVRDIGIVPGILDDAGARGVPANSLTARAKRGRAPPGSSTATGPETAGQQRLIRGAACGGGASSRGPAAPQRAIECRHAPWRFVLPNPGDTA